MPLINFEEQSLNQFQEEQQSVFKEQSQDTPQGLLSQNRSKMNVRGLSQQKTHSPWQAVVARHLNMKKAVLVIYDYTS